MSDLPQRDMIDLHHLFYASNRRIKELEAEKVGREHEHRLDVQRYLKALEDIVDVLTDSMYSESQRIERAIALIDAVREDA